MAKHQTCPLLSIQNQLLTLSIDHCLLVQFAMSSSSVDDNSSTPPALSSVPSSPPSLDGGDVVDERLVAEETKARERNFALEKKRKASLKRKRKAISREDKEKKAKELDDLLKKSKAFSDILTQKTQILGRVGTSLEGKSLGDHDLAMAKQPKCLVGGEMRDYQLEGVTWMYEVCAQGMSGILADEMGLGESYLLRHIHRHRTLISHRQNHPNHRHHRSSTRTGRLPWAAPHHRPA